MGCSSAEEGRAGQAPGPSGPGRSVAASKPRPASAHPIPPRASLPLPLIIFAAAVAGTRQRGRAGERASEQARPDWMAADARPSLAAERAAPPARAAATSRPLKVAAQLPAWPRPPLGPSDSGRAGQWLQRLRRRLGAVGLGVWVLPGSAAFQGG